MTDIVIDKNGPRVTVVEDLFDLNPGYIDAAIRVLRTLGYHITDNPNTETQENTHD